MNYINKKFVTILFASMTACSHAEEKKINDVLDRISSAVEIKDKILSITMKGEGQRYLFTVDDSEAKVLAYEEIIHLKSGFKKATFKSRGYLLTITSKEEDATQYSVEETIDTRSLGGELEQTSKLFILSENEMKEVPIK